MNRFLAITLAFVIGAATATQARGQITCPPGTSRNVVEGELSMKFREKPVAFGLQQSGGVVELYTSDQGETWSLILITPQGHACMVTSGENWTERQKGNKT